MAAYEARQTELRHQRSAFTSATPYLTGYAIKVVDDSGEYGPAASMWRAPHRATTRLLTSFESLPTTSTPRTRRSTRCTPSWPRRSPTTPTPHLGGILSSAYAGPPPEDQLT